MCPYPLSIDPESILNGWYLGPFSAHKLEPREVQCKINRIKTIFPVTFDNSPSKPL